MDDPLTVIIKTKETYFTWNEIKRLYSSIGITKKCKIEEGLENCNYSVNFRYLPFNLQLPTYVSKIQSEIRNGRNFDFKYCWQNFHNKHTHSCSKTVLHEFIECSENTTTPFTMCYKIVPIRLTLQPFVKDDITLSIR